MKRIIYTLACLMLSVGAWAQTLQEQINAAADDATITLSANENLTSTVTIAKNITLDLNGHNITGTGARALQVTNGNVTITGTGTITSTGIADNSSVIRVGDNTSTYAPSLTIDENVTVTSACSYGVTIFGKNASETLVVNGTVTTTSVAASAISGNGSAGLCETTITIGEKANISAENDVAIYHPQAGTLTVNGTVSGLGGIEIKAGSLTVGENAKISATGTATHNANGDGTSTRGYAIAIVENNKYKGVSNINVNSSATITGSISTLVDSNKDGFNPTFDGIAMVAEIGDTKYSKLAEAISAAQNGETITLLADATENVTIPEGKSITLDLNGKTLSGGSVASNGKKAAIVNNGTIIIQDSSAEQTGTIKREDDDTGLSKSNSYYVIDNQGTMTIKSGSVTNKAGVPGAHNGSSLIRNGEVAEGAVLNIEGGTLTQDNFDVIKNGGKNSVLNITGGTINSANSYAILSYDKVNMSDGEVNGNVCFRSYSDEDGDSHGVGNITGGTINGNITVETYPGNTPKILSECNISGDAVINGTLSIGEGNGKTFTANDEKGTIAVSGGTFANPVPEKYCADGYIPTANNDGKYGVKPGSYVAQIDDVKYESLSEAVAAATDGEASTITLLTDVIENITIPAGKNITLDLNSNTLNGKKVANTPTIKNQGTLTLKNGNVRREGEGSASWYVIENEGTITMDEGLNVEGSASSSLIRNNAATAQMTFNAGTYTQTGAFIVVKNDLGNVVINGGTFSTATDKNVLNNWDQMTINGGTFTGNLFNGAYDTDNNKLTVNDGTFNTSQIRTYLGNGKTLCPIEIKGGTFADAQMKYVGTDNKESDTDVQVAVSGGTFANPVPEKYCATDFIPNDNADGTYGVKEGSYIARIDEQGYETLDEAIEAAKQTETDATITLLDDAETTKEALPENVTINANSKVLTMPSFVVLDGQAYTLPKITGAETYKVHTATYKRTNISETEWGTVCLPFSLTSGNGASYYTFNNISGKTLTVDETATVNPHTPVVFNKTAGDLEINETNAIVSLVTPGELKNGALIGTYTSATIPADDGNFYFINGNRFHQVQASLSVPMYRAYINNASSGGAKPRVLSIVVNEDATAIDVVDADANAEIIAIYDASGRKLNAPQKGMNIMKLQNGKTVKLLVK